MIKEYELEWFEDDDDDNAYFLCAYCNSVALIHEEDGTTECPTCKRVNGVIPAEYQQKCPQCGWHVLLHIKNPHSDYRTCYECTRCNNRFAQRNGKVAERIHAPHYCHTCETEAVQCYFIEEIGWTWFCNNCRNKFHEEDNYMRFAERCQVCDKNGVQYIDINDKDYKKCTECGQEYFRDEPIIKEVEQKQALEINMNITVAPRHTAPQTQQNNSTNHMNNNNNIQKQER